MARAAATTADPVTNKEHSHSHAVDNGRHSHGVSADTGKGRLAVALGLIVVFMAGEVVAGILAHSLALLSDAAHMLTDAGAIGLSLFALRLAARPAAGAMTFGLKRAVSSRRRSTAAACSCSPS